MKKVVVGLSGGVDSSFAAYSLLKKGYEVIGVTMLITSIKNVEYGWNFFNDINDAKNVCNKLNIKHYVVDLTDKFKKEIIDYFVNSYLNGETPNPCIRCNRIIKFGLLYEWATKKMNADFFATGHYAKIQRIKGKYFITKASDLFKDQSYFLYQLNKDILKRIIFPCSDYKKKEINKIIKNHNLLNVENKRESFDICFVPDGNYVKYIKKNVDESKIKKGYFLNEKGEKILFRGKLKKNKGIIYYTIGQRKGIGFSIGKKAYVRNISENGDIIIGDKPFIKGVILTEINLFENIENFPDKFHIKLRYNHKGATGKIKNIVYKNTMNKEKIKEMEIELEEPVDASSKGQSGVIYKDNVVLGGGIIKELKFI